MRFRRLMIFFLAALLAGASLCTDAYAGTLSCTVATTCSSGTVIWRMASTANSHAELPSQANYPQLVCCTGVSGLGNSCTGTFATAIKLSATTNAHAEQGTQSNYANSACIQAPTGGSVSVGYQSTNCSGFDTTLGSMSAATNAHVGNSAAFTTQICATAAAAPQSLTFSISDNSIGFGTLVSSAARYATGDTLGSSSEVEAHQLSVTTNAASGYSVTVKGATLTSAQNSGNTITAIGSSPAASSFGTEQFGVYATKSGGVNGTIAAPYATASSFGYDASASTATTFASGTTPTATETYSLHYLANIAAITEAGTYNANLVYVATANF